MASPGGSGRKRSTSRTHGAEEQALNQIAREAEQRLAARRQARAEAREIRMKELEKQQKEAEEKKDRHYDLTSEHQTGSRAIRTYNSRRDSDDSTSTEGGSGDSTRELKKELNELDEKYKKAMMNNAQLDNEKQTYRYQVDLLKDQFEDTEEQLIELQRQHKDRCRELEAKKRDYNDLQKECAFLKQQILMRDELIEQYGLVFISNEELTEGATGEEKPALVTPQAKEIISRVEGSLDERVKHFSEQNSLLEEEVKKLRQKLDEEREKNALSEKYPAPKVEKPSVNGPDMQLLEVQMEAQRQVSDYKFKLKKAEQDITQLEGNVIRLESQVKRYRSSAENAEKMEEELKAEKRRLQRELREAQAQVEELTTSNHHLQKRLEKIKSARNAVMGTGK